MKGQGEKDEEKKERKKINRGGRERQVQDKDGWSIERQLEEKKRFRRKREGEIGRKKETASIFEGGKVIVG